MHARLCLCTFQIDVYKRQAQGLPAPTGGKTGTTDRSCDAWFVGFTPKLTCAVWVGNDENDPMYGVYGGNVPCLLYTSW